MLLLKRKTFEVENGTAVVKAEEAATIADAESIIAAAEHEAATIVDAAKVAYADEKLRGYEDGIAAGRAEILKQKLSLVDESVAYMQKVEGTMADLVVKAIRKFLTDMGDRELIVQIIRKSMQVIVRNQKQITIKVSPAQVEYVKSQVNVLKSEYPALTFIEVTEENRLNDTACIVETEAGSVEASVEGQLKTLEESIRRHFFKEA